VRTKIGVYDFITITLTETIPMLRTGFGRCRAKLFCVKACNVLLCVLEQPRVDNYNAGPNWLKADPVSAG
jgi:hypothetical protein